MAEFKEASLTLLNPGESALAAMDIEERNWGL
jgi:hypothetical protein